MTQQKIILNLLARNGWTPSYDLIKVNTEWGFLGTSSLRRARELVAEQLIRDRDRGKYVEYNITDKGLEHIGLKQPKLLNIEQTYYG